MHPRPVTSADDRLAIQWLASRQWPRGWHPGGLGWALARSQLATQAVALCHEVVRRVHERGGTAVFINAAPRSEYPAPTGAYIKAGIEVQRRGMRHRRPGAADSS